MIHFLKMIKNRTARGLCLLLSVHFLRHRSSVKMLPFCPTLSAHFLCGLQWSRAGDDLLRDLDIIYESLIYWPAICYWLGIKILSSVRNSSSLSSCRFVSASGFSVFHRQHAKPGSTGWGLFSDLDPPTSSNVLGILACSVLPCLSQWNMHINRASQIVSLEGREAVY